MLEIAFVASFIVLTKLALVTVTRALDAIATTRARLAETRAIIASVHRAQRAHAAESAALARIRANGPLFTSHRAPVTFGRKVTA